MRSTSPVSSRDEQAPHLGSCATLTGRAGEKVGADCRESYLDDLDRYWDATFRDQEDEPGQLDEEMVSLIHKMRAYHLAKSAEGSETVADSEPSAKPQGAPRKSKALRIGGAGLIGAIAATAAGIALTK